MTTPTPHGQVPEALRAAPDTSYSPEDRAFHQFWYGHMLEDLMQPPLIGISHSTARYIWDSAIRTQQPASPTPPAQQATKETSGGFHVWRDISTAPKDGSRFVATGHNYGLYSEVRHTCVAQWFRGCWMEVSDWNETSELKYLTHWMPLPSPPDDVAAPAEQQAAPKAVPAAVGHDEDLLEKLYWEFDSQRKKTGEDRLAFKVKMRFYASEFLRRSDGKMTFAQSVSDDMMNLADRLGSEFDDVDPRAWKHLLVYAPKAAPGEVSDTQHSQFLSDVLTAAGLVTHGKQCKALGERLAAMVMRLRAAPQQEAQEPVAWRYNRLGSRVNPWFKEAGREADDLRVGRWDTIAGLYMKPSENHVDWTPLYAAPQPAPAPLSDDTKRLAWMADEWTPGHEKLYDKHVLETGGVGGLDDLRTFIDKQIAAQGGKA